MNIIVLKGRLVRDVELRAASTGMSVGSFTIAVDRPVAKGQEKTADFINCTAFGKTAEIISQYCKKGSSILINGSLRIETYTNKNDQKVTAAKVSVNGFEFCDSKSSSSDSNTSGNLFGSQVSSFDEDIPF